MITDAITGVNILKKNQNIFVAKEQVGALIVDRVT